MAPSGQERAATSAPSFNLTPPGPTVSRVQRVRGIQVLSRKESLGSWGRTRRDSLRVRNPGVVATSDPSPSPGLVSGGDTVAFTKTILWKQSFNNLPISRVLNVKNACLCLLYFSTIPRLPLDVILKPESIKPVEGPGTNVKTGSFNRGKPSLGKPPAAPAAAPTQLIEQLIGNEQENREWQGATEEMF